MKKLFESINFSIVEILAVFLPGSAVTYLLYLKISVIKTLLEVHIYIIKSDSEAYFVFFICSYVIGNILFYMGTYLDSSLYERYYYYYPDPSQNKLQKIISARKKEILGFDDKSIFNNYKWARSVILLNNEAMLTDVERYTAASKFFRTLILPSLFIGLVSIIKDKLVLGIIVELLMLVSIAIYFDQRKKSIRTSLEHVLVLTSNMK